MASDNVLTMLKHTTARGLRFLNAADSQHVYLTNKLQV